MNTQSRKNKASKVSEVRLPTTNYERKTDKDESKVFPNTDDTEKLLSRVMYAGNSNSWQKGNILVNKARPTNKRSRPGSASTKRFYQNPLQRQLRPKNIAGPAKLLRNHNKSSFVLKPQPPNVKKPVRAQSQREILGNKTELLTVVEDDKQEHGFDICKYVNKKAKLAIELARFNKSFTDDESLRQLLLYPKHSSFLAALYRDKTFDVQALIQGGTQYLVKNDGSDHRYNLKLVSSNALGNGRSTSMEFFTLNKNGITYTFGKQTDFMTIEQYETEHTGFHKIKNIRFFKIYRKWKNFTFWKKTLEIQKYKAQKKL